MDALTRAQMPDIYACDGVEGMIASPSPNIWRSTISASLRRGKLARGGGWDHCAGRALACQSVGRADWAWPSGWRNWRAYDARQLPAGHRPSGRLSSGGRAYFATLWAVGGSATTFGQLCGGSICTMDAVYSMTRWRTLRGKARLDGGLAALARRSWSACKSTRCPPEPIMRRGRRRAFLLGCVTQSGAQGGHIALVSKLHAGLPGCHGGDHAEQLLHLWA